MVQPVLAQLRCASENDQQPPFCVLARNITSIFPTFHNLVICPLRDSISQSTRHIMRGREVKTVDDAIAPSQARRLTRVELAASMSVNIFTYGSLMFAQVWRRVVRGRYRSAAATVRDHARYALIGEGYPGMIAQAGGSVPGIVYFAVDAHDVAALDAFEGSAYRRVRGDAGLDSGEKIMADSYLFVLPQQLSDQSWEPEAFQLKHFLTTYCGDRLGE
jgi:gamma-glutamylcyclotransferase (GGCT)/AIG2-like uncharacterized protein YtfP